MYTNIGLLKTDIIMFIYLQKYTAFLTKSIFWFNELCIDEVEAFFSTSDIYSFILNTNILKLKLVLHSLTNLSHTLIPN